jgi:uncharacterized protein DUF4129
MNAATRVWSEIVALVADQVRGGVPTLILLSFLLAVLVGLGWYYWPAWLPWRWRLRFDRSDGSSTRRRTGWRGRFRLGSLRWRLRWRRRKRRPIEAELDLPPDVLPALTADQLAASGRYAEAVRERLRAVVRDLIERGVLPHSPGWTVTELARAAGRARPQLASPLTAAVDVFSEIWYGLRPATAADDTAMRGHAKEISAILAVAVPVGTPS